MLKVWSKGCEVRRGQRPAGEASRLAWRLHAKLRCVNFMLKREVDRGGSVLQKGVPLMP